MGKAEDMRAQRKAMANRMARGAPPPVIPPTPTVIPRTERVRRDPALRIDSNAPYEFIGLKVPVGTTARWRAAAGQESLSAWIRKVCDAVTQKSG